MSKFLSVEEVRAFLRKAVKASGSARKWAKEHEFSNAFVSYVLKGERAPSARMIKILGFKEVKVYEEERDVQSHQQSTNDAVV